VSVQLVTHLAGVRSVSLVPDMETARRQLWPVLCRGGIVDNVSVDGRWLSGSELVSLVERVVSEAPRPIPVAVAVGVSSVLQRLQVA